MFIEQSLVLASYNKVTKPIDLADEDRVNLHFGKRLQARRKFLKVPLREVAVACGVRLQTVSKYESGENIMSAVRMAQIAARLDVPISYFFEGLDMRS